MLSLSAENLANFIGTYGLESEKIIVTDVLDRLVVNTQMWFLDTCPDQQLCRELIISGSYGRTGNAVRYRNFDMLI